MNKQATLEEWSKLYQIATKVKEMKPWEYFWDMDLIGIQEGGEEDTIFVSILGRGGDCYGITVYEGYEGLNNFLMLTMRESMNISVEYAMFSQQNLTCYWGDREELSAKQREVIKELGYKYRGKNNWLYFMSYQEGFYPYNFNQVEVQKMTSHLSHLLEAFEYYQKNKVKVDFDKGNMYLYVNKEKEWMGYESNLPFAAYQFSGLKLTDTKIIDELQKVKKINCVLEADIVYLGACVNDKKYERPGNPRLCLVLDAKSGMALNSDMVEPEGDANICLAEAIINFILRYGAPKEIRVSNIIIEAILGHICELPGIKLRRVKSLPILNDFMNGMRRFR